MSGRGDRAGELHPEEIEEAKRAGRKPEDIRACLHAGVPPKCYEGTDISVELQYESVTSCFLRHEDGTVTCPMGKLKERFRVSKHPFGTIKFYDGAHYFLCKGKEKVAAETALMFTSYNIRRAISIAGGVQKLIRRMMKAIAKMKAQGIPMPI